MITKKELLEKVRLIKNETQLGANTAERIGGTLENIVLTYDDICSINLDISNIILDIFEFSNSELLNGEAVIRMPIEEFVLQCNLDDETILNLEYIISNNVPSKINLIILEEGLICSNIEMNVTKLYDTLIIGIGKYDLLGLEIETEVICVCVYTNRYVLLGFVPESLLYNQKSNDYLVLNLDESIISFDTTSSNNEITFSSTDVYAITGLSNSELYNTVLNMYDNGSIDIKTNIKYNLIGNEVLDTSILNSSATILDNNITIYSEFSMPLVSFFYKILGGVSLDYGLMRASISEDYAEFAFILTSTIKQSQAYIETTDKPGKILIDIAYSAFNSGSENYPKLVNITEPITEDVYITTGGYSNGNSLRKCTLIGNFTINDSYPQQNFYFEHGLEGPLGSPITITEPGNYQFIFQNLKLTINKTYN